METSNQTEGSPHPYGEPPQQEHEAGYEHGQESYVEGTESQEWGWQPTPPVTRAHEPPEQSELEYYSGQEEQAPYYPEQQALPEPEPYPQHQQHFYSPKVQPIQRPQPTQPLVQSVPTTPVPLPAPAPAPAPIPHRTLPSTNAPAGGNQPRRRAILSEESEKAEQLGLSSGRAAATSYMVTGVRHANKRRSSSLFKLIGLLFLINLLIIGAFGAWLYNYFVTQVENRMADFSSKPMQVSPQGGAATTRTPLAGSTGGATSVEVKQLQDEFDKRFSDLKAQLQVAQSRITEYESTQQQQQTRVNALASQVSNSNGSAATVTHAPAESVTSATLPGVESEILPSENELILMKERNRMTGYADEAIATGAREPYERLWQSLEDPRLIKLIHAARAEILRVQNFFLSGSRIESYTIQVGDYFPDNASLKDSQLRDEQLIELLEKKENPWQVRMKAANLLGLRRSRAVGDALVRAVKYDNNLDVVKEATFSFEQMSGYRARIFEPASLDAWWTQYNAAPASAGANKSATTSASGKAEKPEKTEGNGSAPKKSPTPPPAATAATPPPMKEAQPELRLPEWDEEQEARERANQAVADQQKARDKKDAQRQAAAKAANGDEEPAPKKKKGE